MPKTIEITPDRLREAMTSNPAAGKAELATLLGVHYSSLHRKLGDNAELAAVFGELKPARTSRRAPAKRGGAKKAVASNGNGKGRLSAELLRKIKHEFEHVTLYEQVSEFFDDLAKEVAAL